MIKLLQFSIKITELVNKFDLKAVYEETNKFVVRDVVNFYLDFSKHRKYTDSLSVKQVMNKLLNTLLLTTAPILCFSSQEAFDGMPANLFKDYQKPQTVF